jgi:hypothetical protein
MNTIEPHPIQIGIDSFVSAVADPATGLTMSPVQRMRNLLEEVERAAARTKQRWPALSWLHRRHRPASGR